MLPQLLQNYLSSWHQILFWLSFPRAITYHTININNMTQHYYNWIQLKVLHYWWFILLLVHLFSVNFISSTKEITFLALFICLFVCLSVRLSVCWQYYSELYQRIALKFYRKVQGGRRNKRFDFDRDPDHDLAFSKCLEYDNCLWIFDGKGASQDGYLDVYGDYFLYSNSLIDKHKILQRVSDPTPFAKVALSGYFYLLFNLIINFC